MDKGVGKHQKVRSVAFKMEIRVQSLSPLSGLRLTLGLPASGGAYNRIILQ